jgi:hypothetical protein
MLQLQRCDCFKTILALLPRCLLGGRGRPLQLFLSEGPEVYGHIFFCFPLLAFFSLLACLIIMGPGIGTRKLTHRQGTPGCTSHTRGPTTCRSVGHQVIALESVSIHATELHEHHYSCVSLRDAHACAVAGSTVGGVLMFLFPSSESSSGPFLFVSQAPALYYFPKVEFWRTLLNRGLGSICFMRGAGTQA